MQQPADPPLNTPQGIKTRHVQMEADPPIVNAPTVIQQSGPDTQSAWGSMEAAETAENDDAFPTLGKLSKSQKSRVKAKACKAAMAAANSTIPSYVTLVANDPNNATIPLTSHITPTWVHMSTASMVQ